jgi:hypothetical protein
VGVHIGGQLNLNEAKLRNRPGDALILDGAQITGGVFANRLEADGAVRAPVAHIIGGGLELSDAKLRNGDGHALMLNNAQITGTVFANRLEADGEVRAVGVRIGGQLNLNEAKLRNRAGDALTLDNAQITGGVFANRLEADGEVRAQAAHISGQLELIEAKLRNGDADGDALTLDGAQITGGVFANRLEADGVVRAMGVRIDVQLNLNEAKLRNGDDNVLNLHSASIKRLLLGAVDSEGQVSLYGAAITDLITDADPPAPLVATGWQPSDIHGPLRTDWVAARRWLETTTETSVHPGMRWPPSMSATVNPPRVADYALLLPIGSPRTLRGEQN